MVVARWPADCRSLMQSPTAAQFSETLGGFFSNKKNANNSENAQPCQYTSGNSSGEQFWTAVNYKRETTWNGDWKVHVAAQMRPKQCDPFVDRCTSGKLFCIE